MLLVVVVGECGDGGVVAGGVASVLFDEVVAVVGVTGGAVGIVVVGVAADDDVFS